jgi:hypothetical protein
VWKAAINDLLGELNDAGKIDNELWCVDGSAIRAHRAAAGAQKGAARLTAKRPGKQRPLAALAEG